jgi:DNA-binding GntR family transcriptional regulator
MNPSKSTGLRKKKPRRVRSALNIALSTAAIAIERPRNSIASVENPRLSDQAFDRLLEAITSCALPPGSLVTEAQLEEATGFTRVPLRVAVDRLAQLNLVQPLHRRGYKIAPLTLRDVRNTFGLRAIVEPPTARMAVGAVDIQLLRAINRRCSGGFDPASAKAVAEFVRANSEFHLVIARASKNERITEVSIFLMKEIERFYYFGLMRNRRPPEMQDEHEQLIDALENKNPDEAERIARQHIELGQQVVLDAILHGSELADAELTLIR